MAKKASVGKTLFNIALPLGGAALTAGVGMPWLGALIGASLSDTYYESLADLVASVPGDAEKKKALEKLFSTPIEKLGDAIAGVLGDGAYDSYKSYNEATKSDLNYDLPRVVVKVWQTALTEMLPENKIQNSGILTDTDYEQKRKLLLRFWLGKLKATEADDAQLWVLFGNQPDYFLDIEKNKTNFIEALPDEAKIRDLFWDQSLEPAFTDWAKKGNKLPEKWNGAIHQDLKAELSKKLFRKFSSRLKSELNENERAWKSFEFASSLQTISILQSLSSNIDKIKDDTSQIKKDLVELNDILPLLMRDIYNRFDKLENEIKALFTSNQTINELLTDFRKEVNPKLDEIGKDLTEVKDDAKTSAEGVKELLNRIPSSKKSSGKLVEITKDEAIKYLEKLAKEATEVPKYYPEHLRGNKDGETLFDDIRQTVEVVTDRERFQKEFAKMRESLHSAGIFTDVFAYKSSKARIDRPEEFSFDAAKSEKIEPPIDWDEAREKFPRAVILGDPGFGKSWLLRYEARQLATAQKTKLENDEITVADVTLPILTRLTNLAQHAKNKTIAEGLAVAVCPGEKAETSAFREWVKQKIEREECVILLDALDEVSEKPENPNESLSRAKLLEKLETFSADYPKMRILLTSRSVGYLGSPFKDGDENPAKELELTAFEQTQIENFVGKFFSDKATAEKFLATIEDRPQIKGLSQIPLMLGLLCRCFEEDENPEHFSEHRVELYDKCLRGLLREWKEEKRGITVRDVNSIIRMLSKISYRLFPKQQFAETELEELILECLENSPKGDPISELNTAQIIERLEADGILVKAQKGGDPQYIFLHRTFQEYLTAFCLAKREDYQTKALAKIYDSDWTEVLRLLGGTLKERANEYIEALSAKNGEDILQRPFRLAVFAAAEADKYLAEYLADELFTESMSFYLDPPYSLPQEWFVPVAKSWTKRTTEFFREWLQINQIEIDESKRDWAIRSVRELKLNALIPDLIKLLDDSNASPRFRGDVALALAQMKLKQEQIDKLIDILSDEQIYIWDRITLGKIFSRCCKNTKSLFCAMCGARRVRVGCSLTAWFCRRICAKTASVTNICPNVAASELRKRKIWNAGLKGFWNCQPKLKRRLCVRNRNRSRNIKFRERIVIASECLRRF